MDKSFYSIFKTFFKVGTLLLGGGYVILPLLTSELVEKKKWITEDETVISKIEMQPHSRVLIPSGIHVNLPDAIFLKAENKSGNQFILYVNTGPDHFLHAKVYADVASGGAVADLISKTAAPISNGRSRDSSPLARVNKSSSFPIFQMRRKRR